MQNQPYKWYWDKAKKNVVMKLFLLGILFAITSYECQAFCRTCRTLQVTSPFHSFKSPTFLNAKDGNTEGEKRKSKRKSNIKSKRVVPKADDLSPKANSTPIDPIAPIDLTGNLKVEDTVDYEEERNRAFANFEMVNPAPREQFQDRNEVRFSSESKLKPLTGTAAAKKFEYESEGNAVTRYLKELAAPTPVGEEPKAVTALKTITWGAVIVLVLIEIFVSLKVGGAPFRSDGLPEMPEMPDFSKMFMQLPKLPPVLPGIMTPDN